jgi:LysM repeat protein
VIQAGDSLSSIARRHGVTAARLAEVNKISDPNRIRVGQKLTIPDGHAKSVTAASTSAPAPSPAPVVAPTPVPPAQPQFSGASESFVYTVRAGDTLDSIAGDFTVLRTELIMLNNLTGSETLRPGQTLLIPPFTQP